MTPEIDAQQIRYEAHAEVVVPADAAQTPAGGLGGRVSVAPHPLLEVGLGVDAAAGAQDVTVRVGPVLTVFPITRPLPGDGAPFVHAAFAGAAVLDGDAGTRALRQAAALGFGWSVGSERAEVRVASTGWFTADRAVLGVSLGVVTPPRRPAESAPIEPPNPPAEPIRADWWFPHPWCAWMSPDQAAALLAVVPPGTRVLVPGVEGPEWRSTPDLTPVQTDPAGTASVVVAAWPGDRVTVDGVEVALADDGVAIVAVPERPVIVTTVGGGRTHTTEIAPAGGYALWVRPPRPEPLELRFAVGSSEVPPSADEALAGWAAAAGDAAFVVRGGHSPEGEAGANEALARARAEAVAQRLLREGVAPDRLTITTSPTPDAGGDPAAQRVVHVLPVAPGSAP